MSIYLQKTNPQLNMWRFYALDICPTLFGRWSLVRQWGRIGCQGQNREQWYDRPEEAWDAGEKMLKRKIKRGYAYVNPAKIF